MTLEQIFYVSQTVAALGIIASLVFVGLQVRDSAKAVRSATAQAVQENYSSWYLTLAGSNSVLTTTTKGLNDFNSLTTAEKAQFVCSSTAFFAYSQNAFHQWREGHLADELWQCWETILLGFVHTPGGAALWGERSFIFGQEFQDEVKSIMNRRPHPAHKGLGVVPLSVTHPQET